MKSSQVISTTALVLGGLIATTGTQTIVHADSVGPAATGAKTSKVTATSASCEKAVQASQAVTSYATSQAGVASQAASQATTDTQSYASQLETDPAKTAAQEQAEATEAKNKADSAADQALTVATTNASNVQSQATKQAQTDKANADTQAATDKTATENQAQATKNQADANALTAKTNADTQAAGNKASEIEQAQSGKLDSKYTTAVTNAQNKLNSDQAAVDKANADASTAYVATPATNSKDAQTGIHDIQSEKNLPTAIVDPKLSDADTNDTENVIRFYGEDLKNDDSAVITGSLTDSQQNELADYAITLINSWRKTQGLNPIIWTQQAQDATVAVAKMREANKLGIKHTAMDSPSYGELNNISSSEGLSYAQENLAFVDALHDKITMGLMKVRILNEITGMIYQDAFSNWGHKDNLENMQYMGFSVQTNSNTDTSNIFPYVLVFDGYTEISENNVLYTHSVTPTVLTPTSAQTIEASRTSGGATQAQLQVVANDKTALANAQQALTDAKNVVNQSIASQLTAINDNYVKQLQANADAYQAQLTQNDTSYKNALAAAAQTYADTLAANAANEPAKIAQAKANYDAAIAKAQTAYDTAIAAAQQTFETAYAAAHDETPAERDARHVELLTAFKASEAAKLANLKQQQAVDLAAFKAAQDKLVADCLASHQTDQTGKPTTTKPATTNDANGQPVTNQATDQLNSGTTVTTTGRPGGTVPVSLRTSAAKQSVSVVLQNVKPVNAAQARHTTVAKAAILPQTGERRHGASASLFGLMLLSLSSLGYGLLRRKHGNSIF